MAPQGFFIFVLAVFLCPGASVTIPDPLSAIKLKASSAELCTECSGLLQMSTNMISSAHAKGVVYEALHSLCQRLPSDQASECDSQVKTYLTKVLQQTPSHVKSSETCKLFGLCAVKKEELDHDAAEVSSSHLRGHVGESRSEKGEFSPVCSLCVLVIKKLETLLPQNMTEDAIRKLLQEVCSLIPHSYRDQCVGFVEKYGDEIVEFLMSSAAPHTICTLLHLCLFSDTPAPEASLPSDCDSCRTLSVLSRVHLGLNSTEAQTSSFLQSVCDLHPNAIPKCEAFTKVYSSRLLKVLGNQLNAPDACERADLCAPVMKVRPLGENRCTWGPSYWCRDMRTAQECGNQAFCKKFVWK